MASATTRNGKGANQNGGLRKPSWEIVELFPLQGEWEEEDYLALERNSDNRMMELNDGFLEFLPMPVPRHQRIVRYAVRRLEDHVAKNEAGEVLSAPCPVRLWKKQMREPDIFFVKSDRIKDPDRPPEGADLAIEVPSPGKENRDRDLKTKRRVYAKA